MRVHLIVSIIFIAAFFGCQQEPEETTTKGTLHVRIPESIAPLLVAEVQAFSELYKEHGANLSYSVTTSAEAVREFYRDTLKICFTTIPLTSQQKEEAKRVSPDFTVTLFAYDALVLVVNEKNPLRRITTEEIQKILTGEIKRWEEIPHSRMKGALRVALQDSADVASYLYSYYRLNNFKIKEWVKVGAESEVIEKVEKDTRVLGFTSMSWLANLPRNVQVLEVAASTLPSDTLFALAPEAIGKYYIPHAAYIYLRYYPLYMPLYVCCRSPYGNLAAGFTAFLTHNEGQKIVKEKGLLPATLKVVLKPSE